MLILIVYLGKVVEGEVKEQTKQVFLNLIEVLKAADSSLEKVVKTTVFLRDMNDFAAMNEVYGSVSFVINLFCCYLY